MKNLVICLLLTTKLFGQDAVDDNQKKIKVTGRAQIEMEPTSYILDIMLRENYITANKAPEIVVGIDSIENNLKKFIRDMKLDSKKLNQLSVSNSASSFMGQEIILITEVYEYKINEYAELKKVVANINFPGLAGIKVRKIFEIDKDAAEAKLYVAALKNAKIKAETILSSVNKTLGEIIYIDSYDYRYSLPNFDDDYQSNWDNRQVDLNRKKTISALVNVTYEIK
ncbi:MAG: SIMPL domain-containing protein [Bacteroidia bacterium]